jgi:hypothetical protein
MVASYNVTTLYMNEELVQVQSWGLNLNSSMFRDLQPELIVEVGVVLVY